MIAAEVFADWLRRYGAAWIAGDPEAAVRLFTDDAVYFETPFDPPLAGGGAIRRYWSEGARDGQRDVTFAAQPVACDGDSGFARWQATFVRVRNGASVELDGVLAARFAADGRCCEFREWWHRRESPPAPR
jgi:ketosteroid isomerase-like protein